jgi:DNA replicative helicase MCM subunit Mcm2 (Cdc46/Mcm family)
MNSVIGFVIRSSPSSHFPYPREQMIAKHVMNIHMNRPNQNVENGEVIGEIDIDKMKRYIAYCKRYASSIKRESLISTYLVVNVPLAYPKMLRKC